MIYHNSQKREDIIFFADEQGKAWKVISSSCKGAIDHLTANCIAAKRDITIKMSFSKMKMIKLWLLDLFLARSDKPATPAFPANQQQHIYGQVGTIPGLNVATNPYFGQGQHQVDQLANLPITLPEIFSSWTNFASYHNPQETFSDFQLLCWAIQGIAQLVVLSYHEDQLGIVQLNNGIEQILSSFFKLFDCS